MGAFDDLIPASTPEGGPPTGARSASRQAFDSEAPGLSAFDDLIPKNKRRAVPERTAASVASDIASGALQIGPVALKGVMDITRLVTGDAVGRDASEAMGRGIDSIREMVGSERAAVQRSNFEADMGDDKVSIADTLSRNKGALADMVLPTVGSMFLPVGAAGAAGKVATMGKTAAGLDAAALGARVAAVQQAAGIGTVAAQNAADTFVQLLGKGQSMEDAYLGAGITVPFSLIAGKLTGGGAEGAITRAITGREAAKKGVTQFFKAAGREGAQEMGEEAGQITGEAVATGDAPSPTSAGKQLAVAGSLGAVMGGGVDVGTQARAIGKPASTDPAASGQAPGDAGSVNGQAAPAGPAPTPAGDQEQRQPRASALAPEARLAELDLIAQTRELTPVEVAEAKVLVDLFDNGDGSATTPQAPEFSDVPDLDQQSAAADQPGQAVGQPSQAPEAQSPTAADPETAIQPGEQTAAAQTQQAGPGAPTAPATTWIGFLKEKGVPLASIRKGTPQWTALKAEYEGRKAGAVASAMDAGKAIAPASVPASAPVSPDIADQQAAQEGQVAPESLDLQNRDRSRAASVLQMERIARNPDYMRLGPSRSPDTGAPMVFAVGDDHGKVPDDAFGNQDVAVMADGQRVPFVYAVVDATEVQPSNFADGRPNYFHGSTVPGTIKALNNGRVAGLQGAHSLGTSQRYVDELIADAASHGIPEEVIKRTRNPVLVRWYKDASNREGMAAKSQGGGLGLSPGELARSDAVHMDATVLAVLQPGDVNSAANRDFVRAFVGKLMQSGQDVAGLMTADGALSPAGRVRIQAALVQAAYGDADLVQELFDSQHSDIRSIGEALKAVAGQWANMRDSVAAGVLDPQVDITDNLVQAVNLVRKSRQDRVALSDLVTQYDMLSGDVPDPLTVGLVRVFYTGQYLVLATGRAKVEAMLGEYVRQALSTSKEADLFGQQVTAADIVATIIEKGDRNGQAQTEEGRTGADSSGNPGLDLEGGRGPDQRSGQSEPGRGTDGSGEEGGTPATGEDWPGDQARNQGDEAEAVKAISGAPIDQEWTAFAPESGTKGIPRADMPQIQAAHRGALVNFLNARGIAHEQVEVEPSSLKATQAEYSPAKVAQAQQFAGEDRAILIASDGHVLDGHHQWLAKLEQGEPVRAIRLNAPIGQLLEAVKEFPSVKTAPGATDVATVPLGKPDKPRNEDVGEQLYANRRNFTGRGVKWEDIKDLNDTLRIKEVTKARAWPRPDYEKLVADGMPPVLARLIKQVYDGISAGPVASEPTDEALQRYLDTLTKVREGLLSFAQDKAAVADFARLVLKSTPAAYGGGQVSMAELARGGDEARQAATTLVRRIWPEEFKGTMRPFSRGTRATSEIAVIGGNKAYQALQFSNDDFRKWATDITKGWPGKREAWQVQGYRVLEPNAYSLTGAPERRRNPDTGEVEETGAMAFTLSAKQGRGSWRLKADVDAIAGKFFLVQDAGSFAKPFDTKEQAIEAARERVQRKASGGQDVRGMNITDAERTGPARRAEGEDVTSQQLMTEFGFRGVNFGHEGWINQAERQAYLNQAFDGLMDLAEILGVPPKALSLNGELGIAFGAQGKGKAAAHFVPGVNEINLTKTKGAGTLAHEWAHAVDHWFGKQAGFAKDVAPFLSEHAAARPLSADIRPEIIQAYRTIREAMEKRLETIGEARARLETNHARALRNLNGWVAAARRQIEGTAVDNKADLLAEFDQHAEQLRAGTLGDGYERAGNKSYSVAVARIRNLIKDATGRLWSTDETNSLQANASAVQHLAGQLAAERSHEPQKITTTYKSESLAADKDKGGKAYWATPAEMFARAFELYVSDRLAAMERANTFLTDAAERATMTREVPDTGSAFARGAGATKDVYAMPYPRGQERAAMAQAFDQLVGTIQTKETDKGVAMFSRAAKAGALPVSTVQQAVDQIVGRWANQPPVTVLATMDDAPEAARTQYERQNSRGATGQPEGFFYRGRVYLVASMLPTQTDVARVLFHEALGHYGLRAVFGDALRPILAQLAAARPDLMTPKAKQYGMDLSDPVQRARVAEEILASLAQDKPEIGYVKRAVAAIRTWLRQNVPGFKDLAVTDDEIIRSYLLPARDFVERGSGGMSEPSEAGSAFSLGGVPPNQAPAGQQNPWDRMKSKVAALTSPKSIDKLLYEFQDKFVDLKRIRAHIQDLQGTISDLNDAYLGEELFHKRLAKRTEDFLSTELRPLLEGMRSAGIKTEEFETYLHARHAPEANAALAKRNPNRAEIDATRAKADAEVKALQLKLQHARANGSATKAIEDALKEAQGEARKWHGAQAFQGGESKRLALSGMSDADAAAHIAGVDPARRKSMEALALQVDAINAKTLDLLAQYGLMDRASINAWRNAYQFYVPLHRDEAHADSGSHPIGSGFSVKGSASKQRTGSNEKVTHILGHIAMQREAALTRGEKNHVVKKLYLMAAQNPEPTLWSVDKPPMIKTVDQNTDIVRLVVDPLYKTRPNVVMVRIAGKDASITFNEDNPQAVRLAEAMKNLDVGDLHVVLGLAAKGTRWFAAVNTQYNPIFGLVNFARDLSEGLINLSTTPIAGKQLEVAKNVPIAMRAVYRTQRGKGPANAQVQQWAALWNDLQQAGGTTGYRDLFAGAEDRAKALEKELSALDRGQVSKAAHAVVDWLSDYNEAMENSTRLSAYKAALDAGMTKERAASLAKNLTVNFNRKGRQTREIGALYAFFNAAIQGTARMAETLTGPMGQRIMLGGVMVGAIDAMVGMAMMGGDDGEDDNWDRIPKFVKEHSLIIPLGREDYVSLPMPLGFKVFPNIGRLAVEYAAGGQDKTVGKLLGDLMSALVDAFNPLGGTQNLGQMVAPTVIDPVVALMQNRDWTGRPIYREDHSALDPTPGHLRTKDSASTVSKALAKAINTISGGTEYRPGAWSPTPDQIDYVFGQLTGGLGREILKANQAVTSQFTGDELPPYKIPLVGRLYGNTRGPAGQSEKFYENVKALNEVENEIQGRRRKGQDTSAYRAGEPLSRLVGMGNNAEKMVRQLRKTRHAEVERASPGYQERVKRIDQRIGEEMARLNREVSKVHHAEPAP